MFSALCAKEWAKTKRVLLLSLILLIGLMIYVYIYTDQMFRVSGAVQVWNAILLKDASILPSVVRYFPPLIALLIALVQFVPEMIDKRLKLTLHLPLSEIKISTSMLLYGIGILVGTFAILTIGLVIQLRLFYAAEIVWQMLWQLLPWLMGGCAMYIFTAWICLEPVWKQRVCYIPLALGGMALFFFDGKPGAYIAFLPFLLLLLVLLFFFPLYSIARFKDGAQ